MKMYKGNPSSMKRSKVGNSVTGRSYAGDPVKTNTKTIKTASSPESMAKWGNAGNTYTTKLPGGGCPRGAKKSGKRRTSY